MTLSRLQKAESLGKMIGGKNKNRPLISFRFDDGHSTNYTEGFPRLRDAGMKGSFCLVPDWMDVPGRITTAQAIEMANAGHEILSHSLTHPRLPQVTDEQLKKEFIDSKVALEKKIGKEIKSFSVPQGDYGAREDIYCHSVYRNVTTSKDYGGIYNPYGRQKNFYSPFLDTNDFQWAKQRIDYTVQNGGWLIIGIHVLRNLPVESLGNLDTSISVFEQTIDYVKSFMPDGLAVVTVDEGADLVRGGTSYDLMTGKNFINPFA